MKCDCGFALKRFTSYSVLIFAGPCAQGTGPEILFSHSELWSCEVKSCTWFRCCFPQLRALNGQNWQRCRSFSESKHIDELKASQSLPDVLSSLHVQLLFMIAMLMQNRPECFFCWFFFNGLYSLMHSSKFHSPPCCTCARMLKPVPTVKKSKGLTDEYRSLCSLFTPV